MLAIFAVAFAFYRSAKQHAYHEIDNIDPDHSVTNIHAIAADLEKSWQPYVDSRQVKFTVYCDAAIPSQLQLDSKIIYNIMTPLVARAHNQTQSGRVHVHIIQHAPEQMGFDGTLDIIIADTGSGSLESLFIETETDTHIFDLETVEKYVSRLNGTLIHKVNPGKGAEFIARLPFTAQESENQILTLTELLGDAPIAGALNIAAIDSSHVDFEPSESLDTADDYQDFIEPVRAAG